MNQHESLPREEDAPRWLLVSLVVLLLIGSGAALYWLATSGRADQVFGKPPTLGHERVITRPEVESEPAETTTEEAVPTVDDQLATRIARALDERVRVDFAGRQVTIRGAGVQSVVGDYTFWIGRDENNRIPVVLVGEMTGRQPHGETIVRNGDVVTIFGVVRASGHGRVFEQDSLLDDEQRSALAATDTYIAASQVLVHDQ